MRKARILIKGIDAGVLTFSENIYSFQYLPGFAGEQVSLTMPVRSEPYIFTSFPAFFDGLLPEGAQLEGLLRAGKIDKNDFFSQLLAVGEELVGAVSVLPFDE
jgi:serine/threonine-protein kinase HipA